MIFGRAAQQLEEAAAQYEQAGSRLDAVALRSQDCIAAIFTGQESVQWTSPAAQAFVALTFNHVQLARQRQESVQELASAARMIAADLRECAYQARMLEAVLAAASGIPAAAVNDAAADDSAADDPAREALLRRARGATESAPDFLRFLTDHGGPRVLARLQSLGS